MSQIMLQIPVHIEGVDTPVVTATTTFAEPAAGNVVVYANYDETDAAAFAWNPHRKLEHQSGWDMLYRGWKSFAYAPFGATVGSNVYGWIPLDDPNIPARKWAADFTLVTDDVTAGVTLLCIGIDEAFASGDGIYTLEVKTAFDALYGYFKENY